VVEAPKEAEKTMADTTTDVRGAAEDLMRRHRLPEAIDAFRRHLQREPGDIRALLELGICHLLNGSEKLFLTVHERAERLISAARKLPAGTVRLWQRYCGLVAKVTAAALVMGSVATAAYGSGSAHRYSGGVYRPPRPVPVRPASPAPTPARKAPSRPADIHKSRTGQYAWGEWSYAVSIPGSPGSTERRIGVLVYAGRPVTEAKQLDRLWTPWGVLQYFGVGGGESGWLLHRTAGKPIDPTKGRLLPSPVKVISAPKPPAKPGAKPPKAKPAQPGSIDTKRSGRWVWDDWQYVYTVRNAEKPNEARLGRLTYRGRSVRKPKVNDRFWTPWGTMEYFGEKGSSRGWLPATTPEPPGGTDAHLLPSPAAHPAEPKPVSAHRNSGEVFREPRPSSGHKYSGGVYKKL